MVAVPIDISTFITRTPGLHGGKPHISDKGVTVRKIAFWYKKGLNAEEIAAQFGHLSLAEVYVALGYYHANKQEIEDDLVAQAKAAKELETQYTGAKG
ncbi:MAG: DUF433 domain-containing protein [Cyanobacteria bacterium P01_F01_bin.150]